MSDYKEAIEISKFILGQHERIHSLEAQLSEAVERAREYKVEWESACNRERGRIEDVKNLEAQVKELKAQYASSEMSRVAYACKCVELEAKAEQAEKLVESSYQTGRSDGFYEAYINDEGSLIAYTEDNDRLKGELDELQKQNTTLHSINNEWEKDYAILESQNARLKDYISRILRIS